MSELKLYHAPGACSRVVMNALEEIGVPFEDVALDIFKGEQRSPAMLSLNPKGKVPALLVGKRLLTENASILLYLDETFAQAALLPPARDALDRADIRSDLVWISNTLHPLARACLMPGRACPGDPAGARAVALEQLSILLTPIEMRLGTNGWWFGQAWSIADVYFCWALSTACLGGLALDPFPAIAGHRERVQARPSFMRALARERAALARAGIALPPGFAL